jgi:hypothetical protein
LPIPVAERFQVLFCGRMFAGIAGSNSAEGMDFLPLLFCLFCVSSGLYDMLLTHAEDFYRTYV